MLSVPLSGPSSVLLWVVSSVVLSTAPLVLLPRLLLLLLPVLPSVLLPALLVSSSRAARSPPRADQVKPPESPPSLAETSSVLALKKLPLDPKIYPTEAPTKAMRARGVPAVSAAYSVESYPSSEARLFGPETKLVNPKCPVPQAGAPGFHLCRCWRARAVSRGHRRRRYRRRTHPRNPELRPAPSRLPLGARLISWVRRPWRSPS